MREQALEVLDNLLSEPINRDSLANIYLDVRETSDPADLNDLWLKTWICDAYGACEEQEYGAWLILLRPTATDKYWVLFPADPPMDDIPLAAREEDLQSVLDVLTFQASAHTRTK